MNYFQVKLCVHQVIKRLKIADPLVMIVVEELCRLGFSSTEIEIFISGLLGDDATGSSSESISLVRTALAQKDETKLRSALKVLELEFQELWSQIEEWIKKHYADVADELLSALRKVRLSFTTLYQAQSWANNWYQKRFPHPR